MDVRQKVAAFFADYPQHELAKHETILRPGEAVAKVFYIVEGRIDQYDITKSGDEVVTNSFKPGAFMPMSAAINQTPNDYFFEAAVPTLVRIAPADKVVDFLRANPDVALDLLARVYRGVDGVMRRMAHLMGGDAHSRLLFELLNAARRFGEPADGQSVRLRLTETDLAQRTGLARETVNRLLQTLKADEVVRLERGCIIVNNPAELEVRLGEDL